MMKLDDQLLPLKVNECALIFLSNILDRYNNYVEQEVICLALIS